MLRIYLRRGELDFFVLDPGDRVLQPIGVVALGVVGSKVRSAALLPGECSAGSDLAQVQLALQFEHVKDLEVERAWTRLAADVLDE